MKQNKFNTSQAYREAQATVEDNPVLAHMREVAYAPQKVSVLLDEKSNFAKLTEAELKRHRKAAKRLASLSKVGK